MVLLSGQRHTSNPAKTNENIVNFNKLTIHTSTIIKNDNSRVQANNPGIEAFIDENNIVKVVHQCHYIPDDVAVWIAIDYITGEIVISGDNVNNVLTLFDDPNKVKQSLDDLINSYQNAPEQENYMAKNKKKNKTKDDSLCV